MIRVFLKEAPRRHLDGIQRFFVEVEGIPGGGTQVLTRALLKAQAEDALLKVEDELDAYRRPKRAGRRRPPETSWERLKKDTGP